ncbi:MAG: 3-dehydroquinate synthase [Spirochaetales bacterium]|jgi:3-dehydroquinate synthase|nr:3-dehydroquinate synthase [Spirochaetales bacterium]
MTGTDIFSIDGRESHVVYTEGLPALDESGESLYVFDRNTAALFSRLPEGSVVLEPGEQSKSWTGVESILKAAFARGMSRDSVFIAAGGGMICDITAFAASVFMRGAGLRLIPTSLLSMVDASFGGKTAINFGGYKNLVGTFYPAGTITISPAFLTSLPLREFLSGLAEIVKYAMLGDASLYESLREKAAALTRAECRGDAGFLLDVIRRTLLIKARFVGEDPTEKGVRAYLNLGHTFGHGLEAATGFERFTHGEAVAWGTLRALDAGRELGITGRDYAAGAARLFTELGFPAKVSGVPAAEILRAMEKDKKKRLGRVKFVLQRNLCDTFCENLEQALVQKIVERGIV